MKTVEQLFNELDQIAAEVNKRIIEEIIDEMNALIKARAERKSE